MRPWLLLLLSLAACGGGDSPATDAGSPDALLPACSGFGADTCSTRSFCAPGCTGMCDCTCPGPEGYEGCGCGGCADTCFQFAACVDVGCPEAWYASHDPLECQVIDFDCLENQTPFNDECGCGCIDTTISP